MQALRIHAGPRALAHLREHGLGPADIRLIPAAAGGPKGLILNHLDQDIFGRWLPQAPATHQVHLVGASIGAWRMAAAFMVDPVAALQLLETGYTHAAMKAPPGRKPRRIAHRQSANRSVGRRTSPETSAARSYDRGSRRAPTHRS